LGQANDIYTLLRAADRLRENEKIRIVIFGDGKENPKLKAEAKNYNCQMYFCRCET